MANFTVVVGASIAQPSSNFTVRINIMLFNYMNLFITSWMSVRTLAKDHDVMNFYAKAL